MKRTVSSIVIALVAAMVVPFTAASPASAATISPPPVNASQYESTMSVAVTPTDADGVATGPSRQLVSNQTVHPCTWVDCQFSTAVKTGLTASYQTGGTPSTFGHSSVEVMLTDRDTVLRSTLYTWHVKVTWSWGFGIIGTRRVEKWMDNKAPFLSNKGVGTRGNSSYYYTWCCGQAQSGNYNRRTGKAEQCLYWCVYSADPWIWIRVHSNGTFSFDYGVDR